MKNGIYLWVRANYGEGAAGHYLRSLRKAQKREAIQKGNRALYGLPDEYRMAIRQRILDRERQP